MSILSQLMEKPWQDLDESIVLERSRFSSSMSPEKLGLRVFFVVVCVIFSLLLIAYAERIVSVKWRPSPEIGLLWMSTTMLIFASVAMHWAHTSIRREHEAGVQLGMILGGIFAVGFLAVQLVAWKQLSATSVFDISNPAIAFFYLITAIHGLHLIGGLVVWGITASRIWRGCTLDKVRQSIELCGQYWHFLLVIWLILFGLLFSGNDNLVILLSICGLT